MLATITFLSAFLLFQIELIIAKLFLPSYGGSYLVWGACVVFFQAVLLAGYVFAHFFIERFGVRAYLKVHMALLLLPFLFFPGTSIHVDIHSNRLPLVLDVFVRLLTTIGPVFFVLSTVSLVTQSWLAAAKTPRSKHPHILYAVSNIGSFAALWSYPFIFECSLTNTEQLNIWRVFYVALVILNILALRMLPVAAGLEVHQDQKVPVTRKTALRWLLLGAAGVMLFLAVTNIITYEVAPIPLLWILPLSIYLLSFVLTFRKDPWPSKWITAAAVAAVFAGIFLYFRVKLAFMPAAWSIIFFTFILFALCLYVQNELVRSKPAGRSMTLFYVMISLGGFLGGFATSWIVPLFSRSTVEFLLGLGLLAAAFSNKTLRVVLLVVVAAACVLDATFDPRASLVKIRNYYGIYDVYETKDHVRAFLHGTTLHGMEWSDPALRIIPLAYYTPVSPIGEMFIKNYFSAKRVAVVGLGIGATAVYSKPDLAMDFFELDPDVVGLARDYFWYLNLAPGQVRVAVGDARISLAQDNEVYDLMLIDAFGGDSIPVHLINKDVVTFYRRHLNPDGGLLFHIPSRYFDLKPVLAHIAADTGAYAAVKESKQDTITLHTFCAVLTWNKEVFDRLTGTEGWSPLTTGQFKPMRTWSDDFSTVLPILKLDQLWASLKYLKLW